jgi:hypothetical protein
MGPDGKPLMQEVEIPEGIEMQDDLVGANEPEGSGPSIGGGVSAINETTISVDTLPKQNQGLSIPKDQSFIR